MNLALELKHLELRINNIVIATGLPVLNLSEGLSSYKIVWYR